jgi:hypothetical protein
MQRVDATFAGMFKDAQRFALCPDQYAALKEFSCNVGDGSFRIRAIGDLPSIRKTGRFILFGIAVYALPELELLDAIVEKRCKVENPEDRFEIFDVLTCHSQSDFENLIPGIGKVSQTPVVGVWSEATLIDKASGHEAVKVLSKHYDLKWPRPRLSANLLWPYF